MSEKTNSEKAKTDQAARQMHKREERMPDGRLLIYYTFTNSDSTCAPQTPVKQVPDAKVGDQSGEGVIHV